ncbi:MAG TPA: STAS domain-containing protein [Chthoniobacteraceae bacterium]|jgi:hypothetical protein|nr:STAS domain-containing protein [Chthoniobacteraceae bacterium]
MEINTNEYQVWTEESTVYFEGTMRLGGTDSYAPVNDLLTQALAANPTALTLDLTGLEFLNSSGINLLAKFTIAVRKQGGVLLTVRGTPRIPWQGKSLPNLKKLYADLVLVIE